MLIGFDVKCDVVKFTNGMDKQKQLTNWQCCKLTTKILFVNNNDEWRWYYANFSLIFELENTVFCRIKKKVNS